MKNTLCWTCKKCYGQCSWSANFIPVEGWQALPTTLNNNTYVDTSYLVIKCPEYVDDKSEKYRLLPKTEIGEILGISYRTVYRYSNEGLLYMLKKRNINVVYDTENRHFYIDKYAKL
jgi:hypothetical protein